ncbi:TIGR02285 family protein [Psychromonas sp. Urea-02u-13]|uniref:TIGR02285 family protein n=1 Tax=Psychromonas sp. Urea-02u-13 TaxID=2058326 RepID=UPI000C3409F7|nr:TIGR02285 family protein [Psychromonas sp. Urea-02u-13]PKG37467.1 hypothetical protein CXF74_18705 [Psychromonas sp. Urea-02u-13]
MKTLLIGLCLLFTLSTAIAEHTPKIIRWCSSDFPPYFIKQGELQGQGINDKVIKYLQAKLPQYQHKLFKANPARVMLDMSKGKQVVCSALFKTPERQEMLQFSQSPLFLVHPNHLVILKKDRQMFMPFLDTNGVVDLQKLHSSELLLGAGAKRAYTGAIDTFISDYRKKGTVKITRGSNVYGNLLKILKRNRINFTFGYPIETTYVAQQEGIGDIFDVIPVKGMAPSYAVYMSAPKTEWGKTVLADIENVYHSMQSINELSRFYEAWLSDEMKHRYRQQVQLEFEKQF